MNQNPGQTAVWVAVAVAELDISVLMYVCTTNIINPIMLIYT